ncbi:MAG: hypothetical protein GTO54_12620 [Nitrososphaeria archaeon]|nr:hypothetical protein [Nitrososphaeria archaeon]
MSNPEWMNQINWNELTVTLNNLDAENEYELRGKHTIWSRRIGLIHQDYHIVADPIATLTRLKNLVKINVAAANTITREAIKYGYKEGGE